MRQLAGPYGLLRLQPEINLEQIGMVPEKHFPQWPGQTEELAKFFREYIVFIYIKPRLRGQLIVIAGRRRQFSDMSRGKVHRSHRTPRGHAGLRRNF